MFTDYVSINECLHNVSNNLGKLSLNWMINKVLTKIESQLINDRLRNWIIKDFICQIVVIHFTICNMNKKNLRFIVHL